MTTKKKTKKVKIDDGKTWDWDWSSLEDVVTKVAGKEPATGTYAVGKSAALSSGTAGQLPMWQVPKSLRHAVARRMKKGNDKGYPIHNWRTGLGDVAFIRDRASHATVHMDDLLNGNQDIDDIQGNIDALSWFCAFINEAMRLHPDVVKQAFYEDPRDEVAEITEDGGW